MSLNTEEFFTQEGQFTCWAEAEGGCNVIHKFISEAFFCSNIASSQIFEVQKHDIYKYWKNYVSSENILVVVENESEQFEISEEEMNYLVDLAVL